MKYLYIILLSVSLHPMLAQSVTGKIIDTTGAPIPFATIGLYKLPDTLFVAAQISDSAGTFTFSKIETGLYLLKAEAIGFSPVYATSFNMELASSLQLPNLILKPSAINLDKVSVTAIRNTFEIKDGNIIVNIENSPLAKGNTVFDLLSKLPGVSVDNNIIMLNGKEGVIIMIDEKVQQLSNAQLINILKSMNAELVLRIELLKNPPVKYDAAGTSGMVNIITKKTKMSGFSGNAYSEFSQGFYPRSMSGVSLNYKSNKVTVFSNFDYNYSYYRLKDEFNKNINHHDTANTELFAASSLHDLETGINYKVGADWFIGEKNVVGFKVDGGPGSYSSNSKSVTTIYQYNDLGFHHMDAEVISTDTWYIANYNLNAEHKFDTSGTVLNFTTDYTRLTEKLSANIQNHFFDQSSNEILSPNIYRNNNNSASGIIASKLDFIKILNSKTSFETGAKVSVITTSNNYLFERKDNTSGSFSNDTALTNNYTYLEQNFAAYFNFIKSFEKLNLQLGIRAENTNLTGRNTVRNFELKRSYYNVFPNVSIEYAASKKNNFQLNLTRRIDRPQYNDLNPFRFYRDQYAYNEGNPFLLPHYSNSISVGQTWKEKLTHSLTYTRIDNVMMFYTKQDDSTKVTTQSMKNMKFNNYGAYSFYFKHTIKPWWSFSANAVIAYIEYVGEITNIPFRTASFFYSSSITNTILLKKTKVEILSFYRSGKNNGLTQVRSRWMVSCAVKRTFLKEKLDCSIGIDDIFYSGYFRTWVNHDNQNWNYYQINDTRRLVVSINYNFGKLKIEARDLNSNEQEKGRLNH